MSRFGKGKAIVVLGPRQTGKTTLVKTVLQGMPHLFLNGDDATVCQMFLEAGKEKIKTIIGNHNIVFIDEAQRITNMGLIGKIFTDQFPDVQLILSGSSSFEINETISEPMTGRQWQFQLFPISWKEFEDHAGQLEARGQLERRMIFGMYPEIITNAGDETELLTSLTGGYLYKDILAHSGIRKSDLLDKLLRALAWQVGKQVSFNELAQLVGCDKNTAMKYIDLLEKCFIVYRLHAYSRNLRNEIKHSQKIYFQDNGIRNAIIGNFDLPAKRADTGALWENFIITERRKMLANSGSLARSYFWRSRSQQEVDYLEEHRGTLQAWEFKWNSRKKIKALRSFRDAYHLTPTAINPENFAEFVGITPAFS